MTHLDRFAASVTPADAGVVADVRDYVAWRTQQDANFSLGDLDDVEIRSYLLRLKISGMVGELLRQRILSLKRFYDWAQGEKLVSKSPFAAFNFDRPLLRPEQIRRRKEILPSNSHEREMAHLRALNHIGECLNRSADIQSAVQSTLEALVQVMHLKSAWAFLKTNEDTAATLVPANHPHDFALIGGCGLPPGLEHSDRHCLRRAPDCHCQELLRAGALVRAVNVVECTRLRAAAEEAGETEGLLFHATVPLLVGGRSIGMINVATEKWEFLTAADLELLMAAGVQVAAAVERAHLYDLAQTHRKRMAHELELAREVQRGLLPAQLPELEGIRITTHWRSAREVAGDFYDVFLLPDGRCAVVVGDVSGKGAPAALYMALVKGLIRTEASRSRSPAPALSEVNRRLLADCSTKMFVTVFLGFLSREHHTLEYASAGHDPALLRRASGETTEFSSTGLPLGPFEDVRLTDEMIMLAPGDALVAYTDGWVDAANRAGEAYGLSRALAALATAPAAAPELLAHVLADLALFAGEAEQTDDITILVLSVA